MVNYTLTLKKGTNSGLSLFQDGKYLWGLNKIIADGTDNSKALLKYQLINGLP